MVLRREARTPPRLEPAAEPEQADDPLPVPAPGLEQLQHPVVVDAASRQRVTDLVGEVIVADADGIRVAEGADTAATAAAIADVVNNLTSIPSEVNSTPRSIPSRVEAIRA